MYSHFLYRSQFHILHASTTAMHKVNYLNKVHSISMSLSFS